MRLIMGAKTSEKCVVSSTIKHKSIKDRINTFVDHLDKIKIDNKDPLILKVVYCEYSTLLDVIEKEYNGRDDLLYLKLLNSFSTFRSKVVSGYSELVKHLTDSWECVVHEEEELSKKVYSDFEYINSIDDVEDGGANLISAINKFSKDYPTYRLCFSDKEKIRVIFPIKERNIIRDIRNLDRLIDMIKSDIDDHGDLALKMLNKINNEIEMIIMQYNDADLPSYSIAHKLKEDLLRKIVNVTSNSSRNEYKRVRKEEEQISKYEKAQEKRCTLFKKVLKMIKDNHLVERSILYGHTHISNRALKHFVGNIRVADLGEGQTIITTRKARNRWFGGGRDRAAKVLAQYLIASGQYMLLEKLDAVKGDNATAEDIVNLLSELK